MMKVKPTLSANSGAMCRICHDNSPRKALIAPCDCDGTIAWVHRKCVESWLTRSGKNKCELCGAKYILKRRPPKLRQWLQQHPRQLITDALLTVLLTPLAVLSILLCYKGAVTQVEWQNAFESLCLFALGSFLLGVYIAWIFLTVRTHYRAFRDWQVRNPVVKLVLPVSVPKSRTHETIVTFDCDAEDIFFVHLADQSLAPSPPHVGSYHPGMMNEIESPASVVSAGEYSSLGRSYASYSSTPNRRRARHSIP